MRNKIISIIMVLLIILSFVPEGLTIKAKANTTETLAINDFQVNKDSPQVIGKELKLTAKAEGTGKIQYRFVVQ